MTGLPVQDLRSYVIRRSANRFLLFSVVLQLSGQPKISYLQLHVVVEKKISQFEIPMQDPMVVQILDTNNEVIPDYVIHLASTIGIVPALFNHEITPIRVPGLGGTHLTLMSRPLQEQIYNKIKSRAY